MSTKINRDGSRTWTTSNGNYSTTRDRSGRLISETSTIQNGNHGWTKTYSNGKVSKKSW